VAALVLVPALLQNSVAEVVAISSRSFAPGCSGSANPHEREVDSRICLAAANSSDTAFEEVCRPRSVLCPRRMAAFQKVRLLEQPRGAGSYVAIMILVSALLLSVA
jgi:hypothetical protein